MESTFNRKKVWVITVFIILVITLPSINDLLYAQNCRKELIIKGLVSTEDNRDLSAVSIRIYKGNKETDVINVRSDGKFRLNLKLNSTYAILVSENGYSSRLINIDTSVPQWNNKRKFKHEIEVVLEESVNEMNFYSDFPIAIIKFDTNIEEFHYVKNYTLHIRSLMASSD